jgi:two-component system, OmpR family, sensor histidine kinase SenX3
MGVAIALVAGLAVGFAVARMFFPPTSPAPAAVPDTSDADDVPVLLAGAVDHLEIGVVLARSAHDVVYRNAAAQAFSGTHVGVLLDDRVSSIMAEAEAGSVTARLVELQGPPKTWLAISAYPVTGGGAVATIQDVSERMRTDAMRTDFVTNISHELKTPVGAVAVLAEALVDETDPDVIRRLSDHLVEEAHRAVRTIDDLLQLSQIESTRPGDSVVNLTAVVQTAIARGRSVDAGRGVTISGLDTAQSVWIRGDERQLVSAVGNLVENAVKYSRSGGLVQVRTRVDETAVEVMVADQGIGIPSRDLDRVFERFYRVDKARSRETGGTGLGLAIVRHVATNHGGEVLVSSQEGEGSTFVLQLPARRLVSHGDVPDAGAGPCGQPPSAVDDNVEGEESR